MNETKSPSLILAAAPKDKIQIPDSFFEKDGAYFNLLKDPSYLRYSGWNLRTLDTPRLKNGEFWEVRNGGRKLIRLYSDGSLVVLASIDQDFLGWRQEPAPALLHPLATIELIYEFAELYKRILEAFFKVGIKVAACRFKIGIRDLPAETEKLKLRPYETTWGFRAPGFGEDYELESDFVREDSQDLSDAVYEPQYVAYRLASILFRQFGVPGNGMPYTKTDETGKKFIDVEKIKAL